MFITVPNAPVIVAAVQFAPTLFNIEQNLIVAQQLVFEAACKGARVIVLPELCTSGFVMRSTREACDCAQERDGYQTQAFVPIAQRFNCHIVFGYPELFEGLLYNSAAVVGPTGLEGNFQKHNLYGSDACWATASEQQLFTVITAAGRTGALICRDAMNHFRESYKFYKPGQKFYKRGDIDTLCLLTNWGGNYGYPDSAWVELVEETGANVIVANRIGKERDMKFKGGSAILDRVGKIWTNGSSFTEVAIVGGAVII